MIEKITRISNLGVFDNFNWDTSVRDHGNIVLLKKLNIIYGRNYSGKTTLSRIIRSFEQGELKENMRYVDFEIKTDDAILTQDNIADGSLNVRVYNKDFVDENLSFLRDETEDIKSFAILGEQNVDIERQIKEKELSLGSEESKSGLRFESLGKKSKHDSKKSERKRSEESLEGKLRNKANNEIKENALYKNVRYTIRNIIEDIQTIQSSEPIGLSDEQIEQKKRFLLERPKLDIVKQESFISRLKEFEEKTNILIGKLVVPTKPIQDLINDVILEEWVRKGIDLHKEKRSSCAFCNNPLPKNIWVSLGSHFNKESKELRRSINDLKIEINGAIEILSVLKLVPKDLFYNQYQNEFEELNKRFSEVILEHCKNLSICTEELSHREKDIFKKRDALTLKDNSEDLNSIVDSINQLIDSNNSKSKTLNEDQGSARKELRLNEVASFLKDIDYEKELANIKILIKEEEELKDDHELTVKKIKVVEEEIDDLKT